MDSVCSQLFTLTVLFSTVQTDSSKLIQSHFFNSSSGKLLSICRGMKVKNLKTNLKLHTNGVHTKLEAHFSDIWLHSLGANIDHVILKP